MSASRVLKSFCWQSVTEQSYASETAIDGKYYKLKIEYSLSECHSHTHYRVLSAMACL